MANPSIRVSDYPVFRTTAEIETFFIRAEPFVDADKVLVSVSAAPQFDRLGSFEALTQSAGEYGAVFEIITEIERTAYGHGYDLPHLVILPSGWVVLLRHIDAEIGGRGADIEIMICTEGQRKATPVLESLVQILLSLQDATDGRDATKRKTPPLQSRQDMPWPEIFPKELSRDNVEDAYSKLAASRNKASGTASPASRSDLLDQYLHWFSLNRPVRPSPEWAARDTTPKYRQAVREIDLKHHYINMRLGQLSQTGQLYTTPSDVATIAQKAKDWIDKKQGRRLLIYAHGGLVGENLAWEYARDTAQWWMENDIYPIYCIWESGACTAIVQVIREFLGFGTRRAFGFEDAIDGAIEKLVQFGGQSVWEMMKRSAELCSAPGDQYGLTLLASHLKRSFGQSKPAIDLLGHSAGSILLLHFLPRLKAAGLLPSTFQTLAPAATTALYRDRLAAHDQNDLKCRIYAMTDQAERDDTVRGIYRKSLLYLVAQGFEEDAPVRLAGLQKDLTRDKELLTHLTKWSGGVTREALVFSPTPPDTPKRLRSDAVCHGSFDNDRATMWSVMRFIRGATHEDDISRFPEINDKYCRAVSSLETPLPDAVRSSLALIGELRQEPEPAAENGAAPQPSAIATAASARRPSRYALTVGINEYASANRLTGCVNDSDGWRDMLTQRGFDVTQLTRPEETGRDQLVQSLTDLVARSAAGDTIIWHFSGHGIEIMPEFSVEDDFETTGRDQAIVAANASEGLDAQVAHALIDDDINRILENIHPQASLYVFLDCCFAGTATRLSLPGRSRTMGTVLRPGYRPHRNTFTAPLATARGPYDGVRHVLFSAASATQKAIENGTPPQGVFSRAVLELLRSQSGPMTNADYKSRVNALMNSNDQSAGVYCDPAKLNQPFPLV